MLKRSQKRFKSSHDHTEEESKGNVQARVALGDKSDKDEAETILEQVVLGGEDDIVDHFEKSQKKSRNTTLSDDDRPVPSAAWSDEDEDDEHIQISEKDYRHRYFKHRDKTEISTDAYKQTLRSQLEKVTGQPSWAKLRWQKSDDEHDSSDDGDSERLLQATGNYLTAPDILQPGLIQVKQCTDANKQQPSQCKLSAMEFHPGAQVLLTGGSNQTLALFQVDGKHNAKIQSIFLENYPILDAHFSRDGTEVVIASKHKNFKYYDMIAGKVVNVPRIKGLENHRIARFSTSPDGKMMVFLGQYGYMHLISAKSKEWISSLKMNGEVESIAFNADGSRMFSHGEGGEIYVWDMTTRSCVHKFLDDGSIRGTSLAVAPNGQYVAAGSESGVVNLYDETCLVETHPKPVRIVMNLTTPCTRLVFNSTSEILALASNTTAKAFKLLHVPSRTVFANFPENYNQLNIPVSADFSLNSGYIAIGNNKGRALLFRLKHYKNY